MSNRNRAPARVIGEIKPISDANKLLWERYQRPMEAAAATFNAAIQNTQNILGRVIIESEGLDPDKYLFDVDNMRIIPRPNTGGNGGGKPQ